MSQNPQRSTLRQQAEQADQIWHARRRARRGVADAFETVDDPEAIGIGMHDGQIGPRQDFLDIAEPREAAFHLDPLFERQDIGAEDVVRTEDGRFAPSEEVRRTEAAFGFDEQIPDFDVRPEHVMATDDGFGLTEEVEAELTAREIDEQIGFFDVEAQHVERTDDGFALTASAREAIDRAAEAETERRQRQARRDAMRQRRAHRRSEQHRIAEELSEEHGVDVDAGDVTVILSQGEVRIDDDIQAEIAAADIDAQVPEFDVGVDHLEATDDGFRLQEGVQFELAAMDLDEQIEGFDVGVGHIEAIDGGFALTDDVQAQIAAETFGVGPDQVTQMPMLQIQPHPSPHHPGTPTREEVFVPDFDALAVDAAESWTQELGVDVSVDDLERTDTGFRPTEEFQTELAAEELGVDADDIVVEQRMTSIEAHPSPHHPGVPVMEDVFTVDPDAAEFGLTGQPDVDFSAERADWAAQVSAQTDFDIGAEDVLVIGGEFQIRSDVRDAQLAHQLADDMGIDADDIVGFEERDPFEIDFGVGQFRPDADTQLVPILTPEAEAELIASQDPDIEADDLVFDEETGEFFIDDSRADAPGFIATGQALVTGEIGFRDATRQAEMRSLDLIGTGEEHVADLGIATTIGERSAARAVESIAPFTGARGRAAIGEILEFGIDTGIEAAQPRVAAEVRGMDFDRVQSFGTDVAVGTGEHLFGEVIGHVAPPQARAGIQAGIGVGGVFAREEIDAVADMDGLTADALAEDIETADVDVGTIGTGMDRFVAAAPAETARWMEPFGIVGLGMDIGQLAVDDFRAERERQIEVLETAREDPRDLALRDIPDAFGPVLPMSPSRAERWAIGAGAGLAAVGDAEIAEGIEADIRTDPARTFGRVAGAGASLTVAPFAVGAGIGRGGRAVTRATQRQVQRARGRTPVAAEDIARPRVLEGQQDFPLFSREAVPRGTRDRGFPEDVAPAADPVTEFRRLQEAHRGPFDEPGVFHATPEGFPRQPEFEALASPRPTDPDAFFVAPELSPHFLRIPEEGVSAPAVGLPRLGLLDRPEIVRIRDVDIDQMPAGIRSPEEATGFLQRQLGDDTFFVRSPDRISPEAEAVIAGATDDAPGALFEGVGTEFFTTIEGRPVPIREFRPTGTQPVGRVEDVSPGLFGPDELTGISRSIRETTPPPRAEVFPTTTPPTRPTTARETVTARDPTTPVSDVSAPVTPVDPTGPFGTTPGFDASTAFDPTPTDPTAPFDASGVFETTPFDITSGDHTTTPFDITPGGDLTPRDTSLIPDPFIPPGTTPGGDLTPRDTSLIPDPFIPPGPTPSKTFVPPAVDPLSPGVPPFGRIGLGEDGDDPEFVVDEQRDPDTPLFFNPIADVWPPQTGF